MPRSRQYAFHKGKLFLKEDDAVLMVHPWPAPAARIRRGAHGAWHSFIPRHPLLVPFRRPRSESGEEAGQLSLGLDDARRPSESEKRRVALARFRARFPRRVARILEPFRCLQWQLLIGCAWSDRFPDLVESNPVLAYLWVRLRRPAALTARGFSAVAEQPQRELLEDLKLPSSKSARKFLRKVYVPALGWEVAENLGLVLRAADHMERLRHLPKVGAGLLALARSERLLECCSPALLEELSGCREELYGHPTAMRLENHLEMAFQLGQEIGRPFRTREDLHRAHRELVQEYQRGPFAAGSGKPGETGGSFPLPPLPGSQTIRPLTTLAELQREGSHQDNCVASYAGRVRNGSHYIYRVSWPQRCTLSIVRGREGLWERGELEISENRPVAPQTRELVDRWIRDTQGMLGIPR